MRNSQKFCQYAVSGDDVVIADDRVALMYAAFFDDWKVTISSQKSLISFFLVQC